MNAPPVNSIDLALVTELKRAFVDAEKDSSCEAIILASSCRTFSAGLDLKGLHTDDIDYLNHFWTELQGNSSFDLIKSRVLCKSNFVSCEII